MSDLLLSMDKLLEILLKFRVFSHGLHSILDMRFMGGFLSSMVGLVVRGSRQV